MKTFLKFGVLIAVWIGFTACLDVTPEEAPVSLASGEALTFTATSDIDKVTLVWRLDGDRVATGGEYTFVADNPGPDEMVHTLTVTEVGGGARFGHETVSWQITVLPVAPWCYMDEDEDGFGDPDNAVQSADPPANCVDIALATDCDDTDPDIHPDARETIDGIDNDCNGQVDEAVLLYIYAYGWGNLLEIIEMEAQGPITITVEDVNPYWGDQPGYFIYAMQAGYFTEYYYCGYGDTIDVELDPIDPQMFNGTLFITQDYFGPTYLSDTTVEVYQDGALVMDFTTDEAGRFSIDIPPGSYSLSFKDMDGFVYTVPVAVEGTYADFTIPAYAQADKPNIYIYPEQSMVLGLDIAFPHGGYISQSIPDYGSGWRISADPDGLIDGRYHYLFYESVQPDLCQYESGWVVAAQALEPFFRENMALSGFNPAEIDDFIEYWIPRLTDFPYYAVYPQYNSEMDQMTRLEFSVQPDNLLRLVYAVKGVEDDRLNIAEPVIPSFSRQGFTVVEWGVIRK